MLLCGLYLLNKTWLVGRFARAYRALKHVIIKRNKSNLHNCSASSNVYCNNSNDIFGTYCLPSKHCILERSSLANAHIVKIRMHKTPLFAQYYINPRHDLLNFEWMELSFYNSRSTVTPNTGSRNKKQKYWTYQVTTYIF